MSSAADRLRVAVVGGGWAGLAAAVRATALGHQVTLFEMAPQLGGRARSVTHGGLTLDNGQHILIGAYRDTLALMRQVGVDPDAVLHREPLTLRYPDGSGLRLPAGPALLAFARGDYTACVEWLKRVRHIAQVCQPVVGLVAVDVVNGTCRPGARAVQPSKAVGIP